MNLPEGWPTEAMIEAGAKIAESYDKYVKGMPEYKVISKEILEAALAAAPTPPAQEDKPNTQWWNFLREHGDSDEFVCRNRECQQKFFVHKDGVPLPEECPSCKFRAEAEPVGHINRVELFGSHVSVDLNSIGETLPDETPLYTRPDDKLTTRVPYREAFQRGAASCDKLRQAAKEVLRVFDSYMLQESRLPILIVSIENLRAALEGK